MNKYLKMYHKLCAQAKERNAKQGFTINSSKKDRKALARELGLEGHHFLFKSLGGNDHFENIVYMTQVEHMTAHILFTIGKFKDGEIELAKKTWTQRGQIESPILRRNKWLQETVRFKVQQKDKTFSLTPSEAVKYFCIKHDYDWTMPCRANVALMLVVGICCRAAGSKKRKKTPFEFDFSCRKQRKDKKVKVSSLRE